jgi:Zn-dependent M16 (insulinase) family peptidase
MATLSSRFGRAEYAHEVILAQLIYTKYLWDYIRNKGCAYSTLALVTVKKQGFILNSDMDPNPLKTIEAFTNLFRKYIKKLGLNKDDVEKGVMGINARELAPISILENISSYTRYNILGINNRRAEICGNAYLESQANNSKCLVSYIFSYPSMFRP